ncbi:hypothetical protein AB0G87_32020 [Streptomyces asoensis]|uniref:hypothetical protein n=1 Tax=Streptomyces asoensis TaxID=249586 RepID=UPI0033E1F4C1
MTPVQPLKVITRFRDGRIRAYVMDSGVFGALDPAAVFQPRSGDEVVESVVRPGLEQVVYTTLNSVVCLTRAGDLMWTSDFEPYSDERSWHRPGCALSRDGRTVWVYRPDVMAGRQSAVDQWVVHDAESGAVLVRHELKTVGHGARHHVHPVDGSLYLDIDEGQDGSVILRGAARATGEVEFMTYPWQDRYLIDLSPDGQQFMTVDHGQADVTFHHHFSGAVLFTLPVEAFGYHAEGTFVEWSGGYLTPDLAVVTLGGEGPDGQEWFRYHLIDVHTGTLSGEIAVEVTNPYELVPLGDGSWLTDGPDGNPLRWTGTPLPPRPPHPKS